MNKTQVKKATELMREYAQLTENKKALMATIKNELDAYNQGIKETEEQLIAIGEENRDSFDGDGNLNLEHGYLHIANSAVVVCGKKFNWPDFLEQKGDLVKLAFETGKIKKAFLDKEQRKELIALGVQVDNETCVQVILPKK